MGADQAERVKRLKVELGERSYPIFVGSNLRQEVRGEVERLRQAGKPVAAIADRTLAEVQAEWFGDALNEVPSIVMPPGETTKSLTELGNVYAFLAAQRIDRGGCLFAVGGGVVGDLAGFAAASYLRGVDFIQVPTTLLAMVDSSVGGKTGVNIRAGKNLVGAFHQPRAVFADTSLLRTLPPREFSAGMAEVIKYGMLADADLFAELEQVDTLHADHSELPRIIVRCCEIKAEVVKADEREQAKSGGRALLNFGHTYAHAIEAVAGYGSYLHGEAVGVGLVLAAEMSKRLEMIDTSSVERTEALVKRYGLPSRLREPLPTEALLDAMRRDKKVKSGKIRFVAMEELGKAVTVNEVPESLVREIWALAGAS